MVILQLFYSFLLLYMLIITILVLSKLQFVYTFRDAYDHNFLNSNNYPAQIARYYSLLLTKLHEKNPDIQILSCRRTENQVPCALQQSVLTQLSQCQGMIKTTEMKQALKYQNLLECIPPFLHVDCASFYVIDISTHAENHLIFRNSLFIFCVSAHP